MAWGTASFRHAATRLAGAPAARAARRRSWLRARGMGDTDSSAGLRQPAAMTRPCPAWSCPGPAGAHTVSSNSLVQGEKFAEWITLNSTLSLLRLLTSGEHAAGVPALRAEVPELISYRKDARMRRPARVWTLTAAAGIFTAMAFGVTGAIASGNQNAGGGTTTPIKHLVVIFDENVSFDHYFGTYPFAANPSGEPSFTARPGTPSVNGLYAGLDASGQPTGPLLTNNPNESNPVLLDRADAMTCDQDHNYKDEQLADDLGKMDQFVQHTGNGLTLAQCLANENKGLTSPSPVPPGATSNDAVMDYYDGNTVTALWNLAQQYSMSDNAYTTNFGPSTPGAFNVTSAQTYGAICGPASATINDPTCSAPSGLQSPAVNTTSITLPASEDPGPGTTYSDADPTYDICTYLPSADGGDNRAASATLTMGGPNIGTDLNSAGLTWGWFQGGFDNGYVPGQGTAPTIAQICNERHTNVGGSSIVDYSPHHEPFEYYASTANPMHLPPTSVAMIGHQDQANHQYDTADFFAAADSGNLPAVSY